MAEDVEEEGDEGEAEQDQGLAEEEEEEEEEDDASEQDRGLEEEESEGVHCDTQDNNLDTGMKKSENGTNGTEGGADSWSCDQNLGEQQCEEGEEDEVSIAGEEGEAIKTDNLIAIEMVENDDEDNNRIEDDEEDCSEGGEVDKGDQEVVDEELGLDKEVADEEQGDDQQHAEVGDEELGVDNEEQDVDQQDYDVVDEEYSMDDEVDDEESPTEDENDHKTTKEEGGMNCELKEESLEENEPKSEEHHENLEEHKLQETNAFEEGRMDEEDLKKKNKTNYFELDEAGPLQPESLMLTTRLSTSSMASTTSASLFAIEEKKVDQEKGGFDVKAGIQCLRLDQGGNLKEKIERADSREGDTESSLKAKQEGRGPILMFSTLGKNDEEVEEITDEENEVMELEMEVEELDCALQKKIEDKNKQLDLEDEEEDVDEELEDKDRNLLYDSFEEKLQNIFSRK